MTLNTYFIININQILEFDFNSFVEERNNSNPNKAKMETRINEFHKEIDELKAKLKNI